jgi:hypothetical protein
MCAVLLEWIKMTPGNKDYGLAGWILCTNTHGCIPKLLLYPIYLSYTLFSKLS